MMISNGNILQNYFTNALNMKCVQAARLVSFYWKITPQIENRSRLQRLSKKIWKSATDLSTILKYRNIINVIYRRRGSN